MKSKIIAIVIIMIMMSSSLIVLQSNASSDGSGDYEWMSCTGWYAGSEITADGTTLFGECIDSDPQNAGSYYYAQGAVKNSPGRTIETVYGHVFKLPADTHGYIVQKENNIDAIDVCGAGSVNDVGVSCTACISALPSIYAMAADPFVTTGLHEATMSEIAAMCCDSARGVVELFASIIDKDGCAEGAIIMAADQNEAWYMEMYTGHQYLAIKLPKDKMAVFGNEFSLRSIHEGSEYIASEDLVTLAVENEFAVFDEKGELDVKETYASINISYCHMRTWIGHVLFSAEPVGDYDSETEYGLLFTPKEKVTLTQIMELSRNRYEGTPYCPDTTDAKTRVIGTESMHEAHIIQVYSDLPKEMCLVYWGCLSTSEFSTFVPFSNNVTAFTKEYGTLGNQLGLDDTTFYGKAKLLNVICGTNRAILKDAVRGFWSDQEKYLVEIYPKVLETMLEKYNKSPSDASKYATDYSLGVQESAYKDVCRIYDECRLHLINTISSHTYPEKMTVMIDAAEYSERYGWTSEVNGKVMKLTDGKNTVTIEDTSTDLYAECMVSVNGGEPVIEDFDHCNGSFCIPYKYASVFAVNDPVIVFHEHHEKNSSNSNTLLYAAIAVIAIVALIGVAVYYRKSKNARI